MRLSGVIPLLILVLLGVAGCQDSTPEAAETMVQASPEPTLPVGVAFVTITPSASSPETHAPQGTATGPSLVTPVTLTATAEVYPVQSGDTLAGIAASRGVSLDEILALNPNIQPELLLVGQVVIVPPRPTIPAASPVPTNGSPSVEILGLSTYGSAAGGTWVMGDVWNTGAQAIELVQLRVSLKTPGADVLAGQLAWVTPVTIPALARAPFGVLFSSIGPSEVEADVEVVGGRQVYELGNRYFDLAVVDAEVTIGRNPIRVSGQIENLGQRSAGHISIVTTFYDGQESVTGFHELVLDDVIGPGERRPFAFIALPPGGEAAGYEFAIQATALE